MKILLVEDDEQTATLISNALTVHHYLVNLAKDGQTGLDLTKTYSYDLILLDVVVPGLDGISLCRQLRAQGAQMPILMLTGKNSSGDRIEGLEAGADDYVIKPFDLAELVARVRALLRRRQATLQAILTWERLQLDLDACEVTYGKTPIHLTPKEYGLLELFLRNPRRVFDRSALLDNVWKADEFPGERAVTTQVKGLRQKLKAAGMDCDFLETIYGLGYRLRPEPLVSSELSCSELSPVIRPTLQQQAQAEVEAAIDKVWLKLKDTFHEIFELFDRLCAQAIAAQASHTQSLDPELKEKVILEAHRLAGSLGSFGLPEGSSLAQHIEQLLRAKDILSQNEALQLSEWTQALKQIVSQPRNSPSSSDLPAPNQSQLPPPYALSPTTRLLIVDDDIAIAQQIQIAAQASGVEVTIATNLNQARAFYAQAQIELAEHRQTEAALRESEARFRSLCEASPVGIFQTDVMGRCSYTNARWQQFAGLTFHQSLGEGWTNAIHPDDREAVFTKWNQCISEGREFEQQFRFLTPQGQVCWVHARAAAIRNELGEIVGYVGTDEDISEAKLAEVVRQDGARKLIEMSQALSNAVEGISRLDVEGKYLSLNEAYARIVGYEPEEMLGMHWHQTTHSEDLEQLTDAYQNMLTHGKVEVEARGIRKDGSVFYKQLFMVSAYDDQQQFSGHHCFIKDISEAKRDEAVRKQYEATLRQLNQALEVRVQDRTAELIQVNTNLQQQLIHRQQAEEALRRQVAREQLLRGITQKIRQTLNLNEILPIAVQEVRQILNADRALIFQLTPDGAGVVVQESVLPEYPVTAAMHFPDEWFSQECYEFYCQGNPRIVLDVAADNWANCIAEFMQAVSVKSKIVAPIVQHQKEKSPFIWGLLIAHACSHHRQWQQSEAQLLQQIADQMAIALQQAELYEQLQQELKDRQQAQASLQQSEALFRSLSESSPVGIFRNDAQGNCIYTNPRCQEITGATFEETLGDGWQHFIHPEDLEKVLPQRAAQMNAKQETSVELRHIHKNGSIRLCQVKGAPILSPTHELLGYVGTVEDITESRAIEQMKNEFVSIVSHELRTPLASIRGSLGLLASNILSDDPDTAQHMLEIASFETERLVRLVNDILDLERLESNKVILDKQWCNAAILMQQAVEILQPLAEDKQITLTLMPLQFQLWAVPDRIIQTLVNLLSNAIKFSPSGSNVTLTASAQANRVLFEIQDQGRGIPENKLETIFGRFQQVDATDSRNEGGTGLGLAICRNIVQQHNGQIWVESKVGRGSTFYFSIPIPLE
jgi:PAS domain S-box-containing protein